MKFFYIDTSSSYLYTAIIENNNLLIQTKIKYDHNLSKYAIYEVEKMFQKAKLTSKQINKIIVVNGPGSFTGIRIGVTIAKIFAWSLKKDIITISSLEAMAASIKTEKLVVPIIDARRGYLYAGIYKNNKPILKNQYIKLDDLLLELSDQKQEYLIISNDNLNLDNMIKYDPNILEIVNLFKNKKSINPHLVEPNYLKETEAEENLRG